MLLLEFFLRLALILGFLGKFLFLFGKVFHLVGNALDSFLDFGALQQFKSIVHILLHLLDRHLELLRLLEEIVLVEVLHQFLHLLNHLAHLVSHKVFHEGVYFGLLLQKFLALRELLLCLLKLVLLLLYLLHKLFELIFLLNDVLHKLRTVVWRKAFVDKFAFQLIDALLDVLADFLCLINLVLSFAVGLVAHILQVLSRRNIEFHNL